MMRNIISPLEADCVDKIMESCACYREKLVEHCRLYFGYDYETAADCVQEAYAALIKSLKRGKKIQNYKGWLYKVTLNQKKQEIKKEIKRNEYAFADSDEKERAIENELSYTPDYLDEMISDESIEKAAMQIISSLSGEERKLYFAYYCAHKKLSEIAQEFGISVDAVKKRHERLKKRIEEKVKNFEDF